MTRRGSLLLLALAATLLPACRRLAPPAGGNRYSVVGKLTIKGRTRDVVVPATFTTQGATGVFAGSFTLRRGDFAIGEGAWSAFDVVANDVQVRFNIVAAGK